MSEESPATKSYKAGQELLKKDEADPARAAALRLVHRIVHIAFTQGGPLLNDVEALQESFRKQFADPKEAYQYRLYHILIGGSPPGDAPFFDLGAEGQQSLEQGLRRLAEKHRIDISDL